MIIQWKWYFNVAEIKRKRIKGQFTKKEKKKKQKDFLELPVCCCSVALSCKG